MSVSVRSVKTSASVQALVMSCVRCRLLEELIEKEREYQAILHQVLEEREQEIKLLKGRSTLTGPSDVFIPAHRSRTNSEISQFDPVLCFMCADVPVPIANTQTSFQHDGDQELQEWLRLHGADAESVETVRN